MVNVFDDKWMVDKEFKRYQENNQAGRYNQTYEVIESKKKPTKPVKKGGY